MIEAYERLSQRDREEFIRIANLLLTNTFLLRERLDKIEKIVRINRDYSFVERHLELFKNYFTLSGWEIQHDKNYGVISLYNRYGKNRLRLNKITTQMLLTLRLIYEEDREKLSLKKEIITTTGDIVAKMISLGAIEKKPSDQDIISSLSLFKRYSIVDKLEGTWKSPDTRIIIYPSILFIVTNERINQIANGLKELLDEVALDESTYFDEEEEN